MSSSSETDRDFQGLTIIYFIITLVAQTFFFGGYSVLIVSSTRISLKQGLQAKPTKILFFTGIFMYTLSAANWAYSVADVLDRMQFYMNPDPHSLQLYSRITKPYNLFNALVLVNYALSDGIVVWRAWIICFRDLRKFLYIPVTFWILTSLSITATILLRFIEMVKPEWDLEHNRVSVEVINALQLSNIGMSLFSNLSATGVVAATAWRHRQKVKAAFQNHSKADRILLLLVESGLLYCFIAVTVVISLPIRLPYGTLGDIYTPVSIQLAGAYAPVVLLLLQNQKSLNDTDFLGPPSTRNAQFRASGGPTRTVMSTLHFAPSSAPQRNSFESAISSELDHGDFEQSVEGKKQSDLGSLESIV